MSLLSPTGVSADLYSSRFHFLFFLVLLTGFLVSGFGSGALFQFRFWKFWALRGFPDGPCSIDILGCGVCLVVLGSRWAGVFGGPAWCLTPATCRTGELCDLHILYLSNQSTVRRSLRWDPAERRCPAGSSTRRRAAVRPSSMEAAEETRTTT